MGNYCNGTATLKGNCDTLELLSVLVERLDDCVGVSGFDGDEDWLMHVFKQEYSTEGIFYEGSFFEKSNLVLQIRACRTTGDDFFRQMATGLQVEILWDYVSDDTGKEYKRTFKPVKDGIPWKLRTEEELDGDEPDEGPPVDARVFASQPPWSPPSGGSYAPAASFLARGMGVRTSEIVPEKQAYQFQSANSSKMMSLERGQASTPKPDVSAKPFECYNHCLMATRLANAFVSGEIPMLVKSRVAADIFIAIDALLTYDRVTKTEQERQVYFALYSELVDIMREFTNGFKCTASALAYSRVLDNWFDMSLCRKALSYITDISKFVIPDYYVGLAGMGLPVMME